MIAELFRRYPLTTAWYILVAYATAIVEVVT
jgi:hypothetical protein